MACLVSCYPAAVKDTSQVKVVDQSFVDKDLLSPGPYAYTETLYEEAAHIDHEILPLPPEGLPEIETDIRGKLYLPQGTGPFPLLVFLHGNHATCGQMTSAGNPRIDSSIEFTYSGQCPSEMIEVPSFLGYEYAARHLASWGYAVASINANRGITGRNGYDSWDGGLIYARGALVLKHLMKLHQWSKDGDSHSLADPSIKILNAFDFQEVGLMGHSRGGEGVRFAYNIFEQADSKASWKKEIPELRIKGVFEIAPVDFGTGDEPIKVEAIGTAWTVLIAGCDRDVSDFMGTNPYARMLSGSDSLPKAIFAVWGANHNFFNTEWQVSDAPHSCFGNQKPLWNTSAAAMPSPWNFIDPNALSGVTGSETQQAFAKALMLSFFKANVGKDTDRAFLHSFDPQYALPAALQALAPTSREFILLNQSLLVAKPGKSESIKHQDGAIIWESLQEKLQADLPLLQEYWNAFAQSNGLQKVIVQLDPIILARQALLLEAPPLNLEQTVDIPFQESIDTASYWTIDANFARRTGCYSYPDSSCLPDYNPTDIDVALVEEDGRSSAYVHLRDYVNLQNYHSNYFEMASRQPVPNAEDSYILGFRYVPLLFSTARFELSDFALQSPKVKALRLKFPAGQPVALALDEIRLVYREMQTRAH